MNAACARLRGVSPARLLHKAGLLCMIGLLAGCAGVRIKPVSTQEFIAQHRGDILSSGTLSIAARNTLSVIGQDPAPCRDRNSVV